jgi:hypothetical protein
MKTLNANSLFSRHLMANGFDFIGRRIYVEFYRDGYDAFKKPIIVMRVLTSKTEQSSSTIHRKPGGDCSAINFTDRRIGMNAVCVNSVYRVFRQKYKGRNNEFQLQEVNRVTPGSRTRQASPCFSVSDVLKGTGYSPRRSRKSDDNIKYAWSWNDYHRMYSNVA